MKYVIQAYDNFHYVESEFRKVGEYGDIFAAVVASKKVIDEFLADAYKPKMDAKALYDQFLSFGEVPCIWALGDREPDPFHPWEYANKRCEEITGSRIQDEKET